MENNNTLNQRVIFPEEVQLVISEVLGKYNLTETPAEAFEKLKQKKSPRRTIIIRAAKDFFIDSKVLGKDLASLLQKDLNISKEVVQKLIKDIVEKIVPLAKKIAIKEEPAETTSLKTGKLLPKQPIILPPMPSLKTEKAVISDKNKKPLTETEDVSIPQKNLIKRNGEIKKSNNKEDIYREPIE